jgi:hypothetical protein
MDKAVYCFCGMASRYSMIGLQPVGASHVPIPIQGPNTTLRSTLVSHCDLHRYVACISSSGYSTIDSVLLHTSNHIATDEWWIEKTNHVSSLKFLQNLKERTFDWLVGRNVRNQPDTTPHHRKNHGMVDGPQRGSGIHNLEHRRDGQQRRWGRQK